MCFISKRWPDCSQRILEGFRSIHLQMSQRSSFQRFVQVCWVQCTSQCSLCHLWFQMRCICSHSSWLFGLHKLICQFNQNIKRNYLLDVWYRKLISVFLPENKRVLGCNYDIHLVFQNSFHQTHQGSSFLDVYQVLIVRRMWQYSLHLTGTDSHTPDCGRMKASAAFW